MALACDFVSHRNQRSLPWTERRTHHPLRSFRCVMPRSCPPMRAIELSFLSGRSRPPTALLFDLPHWSWLCWFSEAGAISTHLLGSCRMFVTKHLSLVRVLAP